MNNQILDETEIAHPHFYSRLANFWERLGAFSIDILLLSSVWGIFLMIVGWENTGTELFRKVGNSSTIDFQINNLTNPLWYLKMGLFAVYFAAFESSGSQGSVGKSILGLKVTDLEGERIPFGKAFIRFVAKLPSMAILLIGFLMQPFTQNKQALHDILAKTLVYKR